MKSIIIIIAGIAIAGATIAGSLYLHDTAKIKLAEIALASERITAALDTQMLVSRAYASAFRQAGIAVCILIIAGMFIVRGMFRQMTEAVTSMAMLTGGHEDFARRIVKTTRAQELAYDCEMAQKQGHRGCI